MDPFDFNSDLDTISYILELELQIENLKEASVQLTRTNLNNSILIGKLNSDAKKDKRTITQLFSSVEDFEKNSFTKTFFNEKTLLLIAVLQKQRRLSENEEERKLLEEFISLLNKTNGKH